MRPARGGDVIGPDEAIQRIQAKAEKEDRYKILIARLQQTKGDNESAVREKSVERRLPVVEATMILRGVSAVSV